MSNKEQTKAEPRTGIMFNAQFVQVIADYLTTKPYKEVAGIISGLQTGNVIDDLGIALMDTYLNKNYAGFLNLSETVAAALKPTEATPPQAEVKKGAKKGSTKE
jgi:hypothetical protein